MQLLFRSLCSNEVTLYFNLMMYWWKAKTTPERVELTPVGVDLTQFSIQRRVQNLSWLKYILHLKNLSCSISVRKHTLSDLQPVIATIAALYPMGE